MTSHVKISAHKPGKAIHPGSFFFFYPDFVYRNKGCNIICFTLKNDQARIYFKLEKNTATSMGQSPFGGVDAIRGISAESLSILLQSAVRHLSSSGIGNIAIRLFPKAYQPALFDKLEKVLQENGFSLAFNDINQHLTIGNAAFREKIKPDQRRYLNRAAERGVFRIVESTLLHQVYSLLQQNRAVKGYPMTMSFGELRSAFKCFPENYLLFGLFMEGKLAAASVCIKVNKKIIYDFYHGHDANFNSISPVVPLIEGIYGYCKKNNYNVLDLGASSENGNLNNGLYSFKQGLGSEASYKAFYTT